MSSFGIGTIHDQLLPFLLIAGTAVAMLAWLGIRHRRLSSAGQPLVRIRSRHLALLDVTFDAILLVSEQGIVSKANSAAGTLFGGSPAAFIGHSAGTFFRLPEFDYRDALQNDQPPEAFDPTKFTVPSRVIALGLNYRRFPAELRSSAIDLDRTRHYVICIRELNIGAAAQVA